MVAKHKRKLTNLCQTQSSRRGHTGHLTKCPEYPPDHDQFSERQRDDDHANNVCVLENPNRVGHHPRGTEEHRQQYNLKR